MMKVTQKILVLIIVGIFCAGTAVANDTVEIHGFISQGYLKSDENNYFGNSEDGSFEFNELGLNFSADLTDQLRLGTQLFARDLGSTGNDEINVDWAFADYRWRDFLGLRVGKVKVSHGLYNEVRDVDAVRTAALLPGSVYIEQFRATFAGMKGAAIYGEVPGGISYVLGYGTIDISDDDFLANRLAGFIGDTHTGSTAEYARNAALQWSTPINGLRVGASHYGLKTEMTTQLSGKIDLKDISATAGSAEYTIGDFLFAGEYTQYHVEAETAGGVQLLDRYTEAWYLSGSYRVNELFEVGFYYSAIFLDKDDKDGKDALAAGAITVDHAAWQKDVALSGRFDLNESWIVKVEGHVMNGTELIDATTTNPEEDWILGVVKATYSF